MTILRSTKARVYFELASKALQNAEDLCEGKIGKRPLAAHLEELQAFERLNRGWSKHVAFTKPVRGYGVY